MCNDCWIVSTFEVFFPRRMPEEGVPIVYFTFLTCKSLHLTMSLEGKDSSVDVVYNVHKFWIYVINDNTLASECLMLLYVLDEMFMFCRI